MANQNAKQGTAETQPSLNKHEDFVLKYRNMIIGGVVAVVAVIVGIILYNSYKNGQTTDAKDASAAPQQFLSEGEAMLLSAEQQFGEQQWQAALNGDSLGTSKGFLKIAEEYSSTRPGNLARLYAGLCYAHLDKWEDAVKYLEKYDDSDDVLVSPAALAALGNAYAHLNQADKAISTLVKAAEKADNYMLSPIFYIQAGEMQEAQGKKDEALKMYQKAKEYVRLSDVQNAYSALPFTTRIDEYIARVSN